VNSVAGESIESVMRRVRAFQEGAKVTPTKALEKKLELAENADSSVRATSAPMAKDILASQEVTRSRRPLVIGAAAMVLVLVGAIVATITLLLASQGSKPDHQTATAPAKTTAATQTATTAAPIDSSPSISVMDLPRANETHTGRPQLPRRPTAPPSATTTTTPTATVTATAKPNPTSTAFNPESM
jgi:hypothetical protein